MGRCLKTPLTQSSKTWQIRCWPTSRSGWAGAQASMPCSLTWTCSLSLLPSKGWLPSQLQERVSVELEGISSTGRKPSGAWVISGRMEPGPTGCWWSTRARWRRSSGSVDPAGGRRGSGFTRSTTSTTSLTAWTIARRLPMDVLLLWWQRRTGGGWPRRWRRYQLATWITATCGWLPRRGIQERVGLVGKNVV